MPDKKRTDLDWEDVRYFVALARHGTLSATARALRVNHATVARRIASLEMLLGHSIFDRRVNGYVPTPQGKALIKYANDMYEGALSILRQLDAGTDLSGRVRLPIRCLLLTQSGHSLLTKLRWALNSPPACITWMLKFGGDVQSSHFGPRIEVAVFFGG
jgi:DNA-binding transcriptional LysR family regulator